MKEFFKYTLATITGIVISAIFLFFIAIIVLIGVTSGGSAETIVKKNSVMMLSLNGTIVERVKENPIDFILGRENTSYGLDDILASIKKAKEHKDIKGIYIQAGALGTSYASLREIRNALVDFKDSGKFIITYADTYTQGLYYLSSVADKVMLNPKGSVEWKGVAAKPMFFKDLLEKVGVEMQVFKVGTYKSAVEPFIGMEMSEANREQLTEFTHSVWETLLRDVSLSRAISAGELNQAADQGLLFRPAEVSLEAGLVDTLIYQNDIRAYIKKYVGLGEDDKLPVLGLRDMVNVKRNTPKDKSGQVIAVYYAFGDITTSPSGSSDVIASEKVIKDIRALQKDEDVKAVVLRVNSGGGSAYASEQIWYAIEELKKEKPVVVSMGDYAASGGYYISCGADCIVAEETTVTGSIGIFGMIPNASALSKKVGVGFDVVKTNKFSDIGALDRAMNNDEKVLLQAYVNQGYDLFITRCAEGRNMTKEAIDEIGQGRIWTGKKALELGLVDEIGGINRALEIAVERANVDAYTVVAFPEQEGFFSFWLNETPDNYIENKLLKSNLGHYYNDFKLLKNIENTNMLQAKMPFQLMIN